MIEENEAAEMVQSGFLQEEEAKPEKMSPSEMLGRIKHFYEEGKISEERLDQAAENIARSNIEDPILGGGTSFEELFAG